MNRAIMALCLPLSALCAWPALAQSQHDDPTQIPASDLPLPDAPGAVWAAGVSGGAVLHSQAANAPFAMLWLSRSGRQTYVRASLSGYRSVLQQADAALPSTFVVASLGAGGNWHGWVIDALVFGGGQQFGRVNTAAGERASEAGTHAPYFAANLRGGRVFSPGERWRVTPLAGLQWGYTRSLRHRIDFSNNQPVDFQVQERAFVASGAMRVDYALGTHGQHDLALTVTHSVSTNGETTWQSDAAPGQSGALRTVNNPDGWHEIALSSTWQLSRTLWLDTQTARTVGMLSGDGTSYSLGLRFRL